MSAPFKKGDRVLSLDDPLKRIPPDGGVVRNALARYAKPSFKRGDRVVSAYDPLKRGTIRYSREQWDARHQERKTDWKRRECEYTVDWDGGSEDGRAEYVAEVDLLPMLVS